MHEQTTTVAPSASRSEAPAATSPHGSGRIPVVVIGAGPYGLSAAAHLRGAGIEHRVFGDTFSFWREQMPSGMLLRSAWEACTIDAPAKAFSLDAYDREHGPLSRPVPLDDFVRYGAWFEERAGLDIDRRQVDRIERDGAGFRLSLADGQQLEASRVVIAGGIAPFAWRPPLYDNLPAGLASHSSEHQALDGFAGKSVLVVGGGQSALESAALLHEAGAEVEVVVRDDEVHFLRGARLRRRLGPFRPLFYPPTDVGPPGLSLLAAAPRLFRYIPQALAAPITRRCVRPAGAGWLVDRVRNVRVSTGRTVVGVKETDGRVEVTLDDGSERAVDHILLATGYRVDIARYRFLAPELVAEVRNLNGYPRLGPGFESSVRGLHFLGATAVISYGPVMRFVSGTRFAGPGLARYISGR